MQHIFENLDKFGLKGEDVLLLIASRLSALEETFITVYPSLAHQMEKNFIKVLAMNADQSAGVKRLLDAILEGIKNEN